VPHALFFGGETALHGANWHDRFGTPVSHGCVNLAPADAAWLFRWAPPELPERWHGILPGPAGLPTLWVVVEHGSGQGPATRAPSPTERPLAMDVLTGSPVSAHGVASQDQRLRGRRE
jgi:hypothetical protein